MTRFVVDCETLLGIAAGEIEVAAEHKLGRADARPLPGAVDAVPGGEAG